MIFRREEKLSEGGLKVTKFVPDPDPILLFSWRARGGTPKNVLKRVLKMVMCDPLLGKGS